jgi:hypothetical protein
VVILMMIIFLRVLPLHILRNRNLPFTIIKLGHVPTLLAAEDKTGGKHKPAKKINAGSQPDIHHKKRYGNFSNDKIGNDENYTAVEFLRIGWLFDSSCAHGGFAQVVV